MDVAPDCSNSSPQIKRWNTYLFKNKHQHADCQSCDQVPKADAVIPWLAKNRFLVRGKCKHNAFTVRFNYLQNICKTQSLHKHNHWGCLVRIKIIWFPLKNHHWHWSSTCTRVIELPLKTQCNTMQHKDYFPYPGKKLCPIWGHVCHTYNNASWYTHTNCGLYVWLQIHCHWKYSVNFEKQQGSARHPPRCDWPKTGHWWGLFTR